MKDSLFCSEHLSLVCAPYAHVALPQKPVEMSRDHYGRREIRSKNRPEAANEGTSLKSRGKK